MMKRLTISMLLSVACFLTNLQAVEVENLYLVKLPVTEQGRTVLWNASLEGFKEVLVRKSGSTKILQSSEVSSAYRKVTSYLQRYKYASQDSDSEFPYEIALYFEPRLIDGLIQESQMPLWGSNRPLTIIWLAIEENFERKIVLESQAEDELYPVIKENARRRGLPVILPLMDLEDELAVTISDIWGRFPSAIKHASQRYAADVAVYGRINLVGDSWEGKFGYLNQNEQAVFEAVGESKEAVIEQMMDSLADRLCAKYCVVQEIGQKNELMINLTDINNFHEYKAAENYLSSLSSVGKVEVVKLAKFDVLFKLTLLGQVTSTIEGIALSQKMVGVEPPKAAVNPQSLELSNDDQVSAEGALSEQQLILQERSQLNTSGEQSDDLEQLLDESSNLDESLNAASQTENIDSKPVESNLIRTLYYRWIG